MWNFVCVLKNLFVLSVFNSIIFLNLNQGLIQQTILNLLNFWSLWRSVSVQALSNSFVNHFGNHLFLVDLMSFLLVKQNAELVLNELDLVTHVSLHFFLLGLVKDNLSLLIILGLNMMFDLLNNRCLIFTLLILLLVLLLDDVDVVLSFKLRVQSHKRHVIIEDSSTLNQSKTSFVVHHIPKSDAHYANQHV